MKRVLYFSTAHADITETEVNGIVSAAKAKNTACNVTGALAYNGRNFCQLIEGEAETVDTLLNTIAQDARHSGFKVMDEKPITARAFPDWSMHRVNDLEFQVLIDAMKT